MSTGLQFAKTGKAVVLALLRRRAPRSGWTVELLHDRWPKDAGDPPTRFGLVMTLNQLEEQGFIAAQGHESDPTMEEAMQLLASGVLPELRPSAYYLTERGRSFLRDIQVAGSPWRAEATVQKLVDALYRRTTAECCA